MNIRLRISLEFLLLLLFIVAVVLLLAYLVKIDSTAVAMERHEVAHLQSITGEKSK